MLLEATLDGKVHMLTLKDVVHALAAPHNLISISRANEAKIKVGFSNGKAKFITSRGATLMEGHAVGRLYIMDIRIPTKPDQAHAAKGAHTWDQWHRIMGHLNMGSIKMLKSRNMVTGMEIDESVLASTECKDCTIAKQHVTPFPKESHTEIEEIADLTVSDIWGPAWTTSTGGNRYFITFTDGKARRTATYFMKEKSQALQKFKNYKNFVERQKGRKIKKIRVDGAGEFIGKEFREYLEAEGIQLEITAAHSPAQNGISEHLNRTLVEHMCAMVHAYNLPYNLWEEAVAYATHLKNRSPTHALTNHITPDEAFWNKKPDISALQEFGRKCWVLQQDGKNSKLDAKSREFIFTGIANGTKGYRYYNSAT